MAEMETSDIDLHFDSTPNFRPVTGTILYRSCRPDDMTIEDLKRIKELGIKSFIDLRSPKSWEDTAQREEKLIDKFYTPYVVNPNKDGSLNYEELITKKKPQTQEENSEMTAEHLGGHFYSNMVSMEYAVGICSEVAWYRKIALLGYGFTFYAFGHRAVLRKVTEWAMLKPNQSMVVSNYQSMLKYSGSRINAALTMLSEPDNVPSVVCCMHGKDRTGCISALAQYVCGVPRQEIIDGYAASQIHLDRMKDELDHYRRDVGLDESFFTTLPETMETVLTYIDDNYGSVPEYLDSIGFTKEKQEALRNNIKK